jgi:tetratricopeptide (TPR) repeat protein
LEKAQSLLDGGQPNEASAELDRVDELDASNVDAAELRKKIQAALNPPPPPAALQGTGAAAGRGGPGAGRGGSGPSGTTPPGVQPPVDRAKLQDRYNEANRAVLAGDYATAIRLLDQLLRDEPNYPGAAFLLDQAKMALARDDAFGGARKAEAAGDLVTALKLYTEAQRLGAADQDDVNRVRTRMTTEGTSAFNEAKQFYAYGQFERAAPLYQRAYQYLPDSDPNRKIAKDRLDTMGSRGRGQR